MLNRLIICTMTLFFSLAMHASAHSELVSSTPSEGASVTTSISDIQLQFGERVEQVITMTLTDDKGKTVPLNTPKIIGKKVTVHTKKAIPSGNYTLKWKLMSIDGHAVSQNLSFQVKLDGSKDHSTNVEKNNSAVSPSQTKKHIESQEQPVFLMMFIGLLLIIGTAVFYMFKNKRHK